MLGCGKTQDPAPGVERQSPHRHGGQGLQVLRLLDTADEAGCGGRAEDRVGPTGLALTQSRREKGRRRELYLVPTGIRVFGLLGPVAWLKLWLGVQRGLLLEIRYSAL